MWRSPGAFCRVGFLGPQLLSLSVVSLLLCPWRDHWEMTIGHFFPHRFAQLCLWSACTAPRKEGHLLFTCSGSHMTE